jgi:hypothetical protein
MGPISAPPLASVIARKLTTHTVIADADHQALLSLPFRLRTVAARQDIISLGGNTET